MMKIYNLYKMGAYTALLFLAYSIATILILIFLEGGYPQSAKECFDMIAQNKVKALFQFDILSVIVVPFYAILFYSIYEALKEHNEISAKMALFCVLSGVTIFLSSINLASIFNLYNKCAVSSDYTIRQQLLAACEGMLADDMWRNTGAIARGILIEGGAIIFSVLMLHSKVFSKTTAWVGIFTHSFDLGSVILGLFFPFVKTIFTSVAGPLYLVWFILIGWNLYKLSKPPS